MGTLRGNDEVVWMMIMMCMHIVGRGGFGMELAVRRDVIVWKLRRKVKFWSDLVLC